MIEGSTGRLLTFKQFQIAHGLERRKLALELLTSELGYLLRQMAESTRTDDSSIVATALALRQLAGMLDLALIDPEGPSYAPTPEPPPTTAP